MPIIAIHASQNIFNRGNPLLWQQNFSSSSSHFSIPKNPSFSLLKPLVNPCFLHSRPNSCDLLLLILFLHLLREWLLLLLLFTQPWLELGMNVKFLQIATLTFLIPSMEIGKKSPYCFLPILWWSANRISSLFIFPFTFFTTIYTLFITSVSYNSLHQITGFLSAYL